MIMSKIWKLICVLVLVLFLTGCGPDTNMRSLTCNYRDSANDAVASFTIGGFDIRGVNTILLSLQRIYVNRAGQNLILKDMDTDGAISAQEIFMNYDSDYGSGVKYWMTAHLMNLSDEFEDIVNSNSESEYLKLCVEYIVMGYKENSSGGQVYELWVSDAEKLNGVKDYLIKEEGWDEEDILVFKRSRASFVGYETVNDQFNEDAERAEEIKEELKDETLTDEKREELEEELEDIEMKLDANDYVSSGIGSDDQNQNYEYVTDVVLPNVEPWKPTLDPEDIGACEDFIGTVDEEGSPAYYIDFVYDIVKIGTTIVLILLSMFDLVNAIISEKALNGIYRKLIYRLIIVLIVLLLPTLITLVGELLTGKDILCGIG